MHTGTQTFNEFLSSLATKQPTPGGGSVAGLVAALSSSLGNMVLAYSDGIESLKNHESLHTDCAQFLLAAKDEALELSQADEAAYKALNTMFKLPKDDPDRISNWNDTVGETISVPIRTMELCNRVLMTLQTLVGKTNSMLTSDLAIAAILADAAARSAHWNVLVNLPLLESDEDRDTFSTHASDVLDQCNDVSNSIQTSCRL